MPMGIYPRKPLSERFWRWVKRGTNEECWYWLGQVRRPGHRLLPYGSIQENGKSYQAHRVAFELCVGPIPKGLCVLHRCDIPQCVNPAHLFLGTRTDNVKDMWSKGRAARKDGERNGRAILTRTQVQEIRKEKFLTHRQMAKMYGVSLSTIGMIRSNYTWRHD